MNNPKMEELISQALSKRHLWLFLDYDGTLADFAPTPDDLIPLPHVINLLKRLSSKPTIRLAVISGRRLADICRLLPLSGIFIAGTYGVEFKTPAGELVQRVNFDDIRPFLEVVKPAWIEILGQRPGFFLEDKGWALALHARFAEEQDAVQVLALARQVASHSLPEERFRILGGHKFLEVAPLLAHKGQTVQYWVEHFPWSGARLLYIGDDDKDEEAFAAVHSYDGIAIKVASTSQPQLPTQADHILESPAAVNAWLETLYRRL